MDYVSIAEMLRQHVVGSTDAAELKAAVAITHNLAGFFEEADTRFDVVAFLSAAGIVVEL
jgi:hypothetical protein